MDDDVKELKRLKSLLPNVSATVIAFEASLNPNTVYAALRGKAGQNSIDRVRKTLHQLIERKAKAAG